MQNSFLGNRFWENKIRNMLWSGWNALWKMFSVKYFCIMEIVFWKRRCEDECLQKIYFVKREITYEKRFPKENFLILESVFWKIKSYLIGNIFQKLLFIFQKTFFKIKKFFSKKCFSKYKKNDFQTRTFPILWISNKV